MAAVLAAHASLGVMRGSFSRVAGDEGTFLAMTESLVRDGDLRFDAADLSRIDGSDEPGRGTVILQRTGDSLAYSKPVVYPLLAAPFMALGGEPALLVFNALALGGSLLLAYRALGRRGRGGVPPIWVLLTAVGVSVVPSYLAYRMSDLLQVALVLGGLALCCLEASRRAAAGTSTERRRGPVLAACGGLLLGLAAVARYPNLLALAAAVGCLAVMRRWRAAGATVAAGALSIVALSVLTAGLTGAANPYKAERASFDRDSGYPVSARSVVAEEGFATRLATQRLAARPLWQPRVSAWSALYYLIGRHTGLLLYFPAAFVLVLSALRRPDAVGRVLLGAVAAGALFYVVWMPRNYFGGSTFIGDRYFLTLFPLLLLAPGRSPGRASLVGVWIVGFLVWASAVASVARAGELDRSSQSHAYAGVFRWLPYESTAKAIDGWRDRYWEGTFWRFTDPWAEPGGDGFLLEPGRPPAETLLASRGPLAALRLAVRSRAREVTVELADWRRTRVVVLDTSGPAGRAVVEVPVATAWRRHPFWWAPGAPYDVRALRWRVLGGEPARVRFLGTVPVVAGTDGRSAGQNGMSSSSMPPPDPPPMSPGSS